MANVTALNTKYGVISKTEYDSYKVLVDKLNDIVAGLLLNYSAITIELTTISSQLNNLIDSIPKLSAKVATIQTSLDVLSSATGYEMEVLSAATYIGLANLGAKLTDAQNSYNETTANTANRFNTLANKVDSTTSYVLSAATVQLEENQKKTDEALEEIKKQAAKSGSGTIIVTPTTISFKANGEFDKSGYLIVTPTSLSFNGN